MNLANRGSSSGGDTYRIGMSKSQMECLGGGLRKALNTKRTLSQESMIRFPKEKGVSAHYKLADCRIKETVWLVHLQSACIKVRPQCSSCWPGLESVNHTQKAGRHHA